MLGDTIVAVASPPPVDDGARRGVVRVSGPGAFAAAAVVLRDATLEPRRAAWTTELAGSAIGGAGVSTLVLTMPGPRSFTGEDVVELHVPGGSALLRRLVAALRGATGDAEVVRDALPGEFTRRAFANGRLDLAAAEAVLELVHAATAAERRQALYVLGGGLAAAIDRVRARVQDALAMLEAGLDFTAEETGAVDPATWLAPLGEARDDLAAVWRGSPAADRQGGELVVVGVTNVGKSSLCNALAGRDVVLVADEVGTTRDVVAVELGDGVTLLDAPGVIEALSAESVDARSLTVAADVRRRARGCLLVVDVAASADDVAAAVRAPAADDDLPPVIAVVRTKVDRLRGAPEPIDGVDLPTFTVSSTTGAGLDALRAFLRSAVARAAGTASDRGGGSRVREHVGRALARLRDVAGERVGPAVGLPEEVVALELAAVLADLDAVHGRSSPEDLLDRIFGRFCLGK